MNNLENEEFEIDLTRLLEIVKKYLWLYAGLCIIFAALGFGYTKMFVPNYYSASAQIIIVSNDSRATALSANEVALNQKLAVTYANIIKSERIGDLVVRNLDYEITTSQYMNLVYVGEVDETEILYVGVTHTDPIFAAKLANEVVSVFIDEIGSIMPVDNVSILTKAKTPTAPSGPSTKSNMMKFVLVAIVISGLHCLIKLLKDNKLKSADDIANVVTYPLIGSIPEFKDGENLEDVNSVYGESVRALRTNITMRGFDSDLKVINIISSTQGEGKSTTLISLANALSTIDKKVLVIDLDLKAASVHKRLKIKNKFGITDLVNNQSKLNDTVVNINKNFDVITSGTTIPFTSEFLQSNALKNFIEKIKEDYDYVLLDSAPASIVTDGTIVSKIADGTILVVASNTIEKKQLKSLDNIIKQFNINIIGVVMTRLPFDKKKGYYNGYSYSYGYNHDGDKKKKKNKN